MRKLVPILALTLCAFLLISLATPAASQGTFPADNDQLDYEFKADALFKYAVGPPDDDYDIQVDFSHVIQNHTDDMYYANATATWVGPSDIFGPYTGLSNWTALMHHYDEDTILHIHPMNPMDWTEYAPFWFSDIVYITPGLIPGDTLQFGYSQSSPPYENNTYMAFGIPVMAGPTFTVGLNQLSTVKIGFDYLYYENQSIFYPPYSGYWDMTVEFEIIWEWSLGFLCQINFDYYVNLYPYSMWDYTEIFMSGNLTLVDYSLAATPTAYTGAINPAANLPIIIAVVAVVIVICIIIFLLIYRSKRGK